MKRVQQITTHKVSKNQGGKTIENYNSVKQYVPVNKNCICGNSPNIWPIDILLQEELQSHQIT